MQEETHRSRQLLCPNNGVTQQKQGCEDNGVAHHHAGVDILRAANSDVQIGRSNVVLLLLHRTALELLLLVNVEADLVPGVDAEPLLEHLPDAEDGVRLRGVGQPDCQLVALGADVHHSTVHLEYNILPLITFYNKKAINT